MRWPVGVMVSIVSGPGWSGLWCLWCLGQSDRGYRVYGVCCFGPGWSGYDVYGVSARVVGAMVSMVPAGSDLGGQGYGVCCFGPGWSGLWCLWCLGQGGQGYGVCGV